VKGVKNPAAPLGRPARQSDRKIYCSFKFLKVMKISVLNLLRGGVFVLAAGAAVAFSEPEPEFQTAWGIISPAPNLVTQEVEVNGGQFNCDSEVQETCLYSDSMATTPLPNYPQGRFEFTGSR
jgi:hypothetical protein